MQKLNELFRIFNRRKFLIEICNLDPDNGLNHRLAGHGTNDKDKNTEPKPEEKKAIKEGLIIMVNKINSVIETLD